MENRSFLSVGFQYFLPELFAIALPLVSLISVSHSSLIYIAKVMVLKYKSNQVYFFIKPTMTLYVYKTNKVYKAHSNLKPSYFSSHTSHYPLSWAHFLWLWTTHQTLNMPSVFMLTALPSTYPSRPTSNFYLLWGPFPNT